MALDKFRAAVLVIAGGFPQRLQCDPGGSDPQQNAGGSTGRIPARAHNATWVRRAHGVVYRNVTSASAGGLCSAVWLGARPGCRTSPFPATHRERYGRIAGA